VIATEHSRALTSTTITTAPARPSCLATSGALASGRWSSAAGRGGGAKIDAPLHPFEQRCRPPGGAQGHPPLRPACIQRSGRQRSTGTRASIENARRVHSGSVSAG